MNKRKIAFEEWNKGGPISDDNLDIVIEDLKYVCNVFQLIAKGPTLTGLYIMLDSACNMKEARKR